MTRLSDDDKKVMKLADKLESYFRRLLRSGEISRQQYVYFMDVTLNIVHDGVDDDDVAECIQITLENKHKPKLTEIK